MKDREVEQIIDNALSYYYTGSFSLSTFIDRLLRIATQINDPKLKFMTRLDMHSTDSSMNNTIRGDFKREMTELGYSHKSFLKIYRAIISEYLQRRETSSKDKSGDKLLNVNSISCIE